MKEKEAERVRLDFENRYGMQMGRIPTHIYLRPHPVLRPFVAHYTVCIPGPGLSSGGTLDLIPDASGCLVFTLLSGGLEGRMYGPTTRVVTVSADFGDCPFRFFVEFKPGGLGYFTDVPQWELADKVVPLDATAPRLNALIHSLFDACPDLDEFVRCSDAALAALAPAPGAFLPMLRALSVTRGTAAVEELAEYTCYSRRHLARLFRAGTGLSAKSFSRVLRINEAVRLLPAAASLTALAQDLGYFDQAHFIHDFRSVAQVSPGEYLSRLSRFYNEPLKF